MCHNLLALLRWNYWIFSLMKLSQKSGAFVSQPRVVYASILLCMVQHGATSWFPHDLTDDVTQAKWNNPAVNQRGTFAWSKDPNCRVKLQNCTSFISFTHWGHWEVISYLAQFSLNSLTLSSEAMFHFLKWFHIPVISSKRIN